MQVKLYDSEFEITDSMLEAGRFMANTVIPVAEAAVDGIADIYKKCENLETVARNLISVKDEFYEGVAKAYVKLLHSENIIDYDYDAEDFLADYYSVFKNFDLDKLCKIIIDSYNNLTSQKLSAEVKRDFRKATRSKMYGTTLGSSALAGTFNLLNYAAHTVFNAVDGAITNSDIEENMQNLYEEYETEVFECTYSDVYNMGLLYCAIAEFDNFYTRNWKKAVKLQRAIDSGEIPKNKLREKVAEVLYLQPQEKDNYIWAFKLLGDDYYKLIEYAELFEQKAAVKEIYGAMAEIEVQKKKKQQELKIKAEKVAAAKTRQDELKNLSKKLFGDNAEQFNKMYAENIFYPLLLDTPDVNFADFSIQVCNAAKKFLDGASKYIWGRDNFYFERKFNDELKEMFGKFKVAPPNFSDVLVMISCEFFNTILMTDKKIISVTVSEPPLEILYSDIKNFRYVRKEGVMTYDDYIEIDGKTFASVDFDEKIFSLVKQIMEIFKLKRYCIILRKGSLKNLFLRNTTAENKPQISKSEFKAELRDNYKFNTYVYYNYANDEKAQKKFSAALGSYAKLSSGEEPFVLFDSTLFGSAKDGFILTDKGFYSHDIGLSQNFIPYENFGVAQDTKGKDKIIKINAVEIYTAALKDEDIEKLVNVIRKCRDYFTSQKNSAPPKIEKPAENLPVETADTWDELADKKAAPSTPIKKVDNGDIKNFVRQLQEKYKFSHNIYYNDFSSDNTKPQKKIKSAVKSYAKLSQNEIALICCDSTLFGGGDEGFLITNKGVHSESYLYKKTFVGYVDNNLTVSQNEKYVVINEVVVLDTGIFSADEKNFLINLINECKKYFS